MRARLAGAAVGVVFGVALAASGMSSPDVIRQALLFEHGYLFLLMASAIATATAGQTLLRRAGRRALLTGARIGWQPERPAPRHLVGSLLFGIGWGVSDACPGPILTQLGLGVGWAVFTLAGVAVGIRAYQLRAHAETEPAQEPASASAAS
jgi:uncharacterized membrane protein YedE/YeeE